MDQEPELKPNEPKSKQELNAELNTFFSMIPIKEPRRRTSLPPQSSAPTDDHSPRSSTEDIDIEGDYDYRVWSKLDDLLSKAPITEGMRKTISVNLTMWIDLGIYKDDYEEEVQEYFYFIDQNLESGGIFDKEKASVMERKAISRETIALANSEERLQKQMDEVTIQDPEILSEIEAQKLRLQKRKEELTLWIGDFRTNYEEDIVS